MSICDLNNCTGCMACYNVCPRKCISMSYSEDGTLYPNINEDLCSGCNLCSNICPANKIMETNSPKSAYACWDLDESNRKSSSSGGFASVCYSHFIENNGIVYGCYYDKNLQLKFSKATTLQEIIKFKTSKYSQSYMGNIYTEILNYLKSNTPVLFIGTPCQVAGLKSYLKKDYDNLITIDLICHGVPSQKILDDYIKTLNLDSIPDNITFRGINNYYFVLYNNSNIIYSEKSSDNAYYESFLSSLFNRESCYDCKYANTNRVSDITIGDFWGLGKEIPFEHDKENGVSLVLLNTEKGTNLFSNIQDKIFYEERSIDEAVKGNDQLRHPSIKPENFDKFKKLYIKHGFDYAINQCFKKEEL